MKQLILKPNDWPCTLGDCPEGLFLHKGEHGETLGMKSEYKKESGKHPQFWQSDAYCVESGEYFWGGTNDAIEREKIIVQPLIYQWEEE